MKAKFLLVLALCGAVTTAQAQLKVHSNGNIGIQTTATPYSPLSVSYGGLSDYLIACKGERKSLYCNSQDTTGCASFNLLPSSNASSSTNLRVHTLPASPMPQDALSLGIWSIAYGGEYNYGVVGCTKRSMYGAGIVGCDCPVYPSKTKFDKAYAGFFYGDVKTTGNIYVDGSVQGIVLGASAAAGKGNTTKALMHQTPTSELLSTLSATTYQIGSTASREEISYDEHKEIVSQLGDELSREEIDDVLKDIRTTTGKARQQIEQKTHYALDAEQLQEVFPDLVYETEEGEKAINYVELIPLLVESINELTAKVKSLEKNANMGMVRSAATGLSTAPAASNALLYQNAPNPFTSQTVIRFSLPENTPASYIYIFDMQGKMVKQLPVNASMQSVTINGYELQAGIYLYSLVVGGKEIDTKRMILSK